MAATDESQRKSTVREYYEALLIAVIFVNFVRIFVFQAFKIPTGSMEDNLKVGDHIIVNKFIYGPFPNSPLQGSITSRPSPPSCPATSSPPARPPAPARASIRRAG